MPVLAAQFRFLSTLSLRRATARQGMLDAPADHFYPRSPCGERHDTYVIMEATKVISIHALLAESDQAHQGQKAQDQYFYPRSPCGERQQTAPIIWVQGEISIHALLAESDF